MSLHTDSGPRRGELLARIPRPWHHDQPAAPDGDRPHIVIIGGGFGGLTAAKELRDLPVRVTLIDRRNYHLFQPLLYQVATASLLASDIATPIRTILRRQRNTTVLMEEVQSIDLDRREVVLAHSRIAYDDLILSAGAETTYFGNDDWESIAPGLKSVEDAVEIRNRVFAAFEAAERTDDESERRRLLTFVVVGGGATGVELAGALGEIAHHTLKHEFRKIDPSSTRIILVHSRSRLLDDFPEKLSRSAQRGLERLGVEVRTGARVTGVAPGLAWLGDERIETETVLWAAGVRPSGLARSLGVPLEHGHVPVLPDLSIPGHPDAFAIGDVATMTDARGRPLPGTAPVAIQQAQTVIANLQRRWRGEPAVPFVYHDRGVMATVGRGQAIAVIRGLAFDGRLAWLTWAIVHVYLLIGFRNRIAVMMQWVWAYLTWQRSGRLITDLHPSPVTDVLIHEGGTGTRRVPADTRERTETPIAARRR